VIGLVTQRERKTDLRAAHPHVDAGDERADDIAELAERRACIAHNLELVSDPTLAETISG